MVRSRQTLHCERCERGRLYPTAKPSLLLIVPRIPRRAGRESLARYSLYFVGYVTAYPRHSANAPSGLATSRQLQPLYAVLRKLCVEPHLRGYRVLYKRTKTLVFVEVKLRRGTGYGDPLEAVTHRKQNTLRSVAEHYLYTRNPPFLTLRFDVIGILADRPEVRLHHIEDAF